MFDLSGKVALVIGGTGTLCGEMANALEAQGAKAVRVGRSRSGEEGGKFYEACDVTDLSALEALRDAVLQRFGRIDILINGAGVNSPTPFFEVSEEEVERILSTNLKGLFFACQVFGKYFVERAEKEKTGASIINLGSVSGLKPLSRVFSYSMSKAAVHNLSANLAREWGPLGIRVNTLVPGFIPAEQNRKVLDPSRLEAILSHSPAARLGVPSDLAGATVLLASDEGAFMTGSELVVDGGFSAMTI